MLSLAHKNISILIGSQEFDIFHIAFSIFSLRRYKIIMQDCLIAFACNHGTIIEQE